MSVLLVGAAFTGTKCLAAATNELTRATSLSRQFIVHAPGALLPHALCVFAEQVRREWRARLGLTQPWRDPIVIVIRERDPKQAAGRTPNVGAFKTDQHLKYQITWLSPPPLEQSRLIAAIIEALCAETANRNQPVSPSETYVSAPVPPWLVYGFSRVVRGRDERLLRIAQRTLNAGHPPTAASMLKTSELPEDDIAVELFEAHAWIFTEGLLGLDRGADRLRQYLAECGVTKSAMDAFWKVYQSEFGDEAGLEKWWGIELGNRTQLVLAQDLNVADSQQAIDRILRTPVSVLDSNQSALAEEDLPLERLWQYYEEPWLPAAIGEKTAKLIAIREQVAPTYPAVIDAYVEALQWLKGKHINRFRRSIETAQQLWRSTDKTFAEVDAYLDQMEVLHSPLLLDEHFKLFRTLQKIDEIESRRHNPVGDYLDQFDR